jgi:tight adherence protein C
MVLLLIFMLVFATVFILVFLIFSAYSADSAHIALRLKSLDEIKRDSFPIHEELDKPFIQRILSPLSSDVFSGIVKLTPQSLRHWVDEEIASAGGFWGIGTAGFLIFWLILGVGISLLAIGLAIAIGQGKKALWFGLIGMIIGGLLPVVVLKQKRKKREGMIRRSLPDVLDLLTVSIEAGLGFDGALAKLSEKMKGVLVEEFTRLLQEMRIGVPRKDALHAMSKRCNEPDLSLFTASLIQADQLGVSIGSVLRVQAAAMREKRRQRAQEQAMKAPIKMLIPLVLFIFPSIFVVLLGSAAIQIITNFK